MLLLDITSFFLFQDSKSDLGSQDNMLVLFERLKNFTRQTNDICSGERYQD